jgi:hypothetical protein
MVGNILHKGAGGLDRRFLAGLFTEPEILNAGEAVLLLPECGEPELRKHLRPARKPNWQVHFVFLHGATSPTKNKLTLSFAGGSGKLKAGGHPCFRSPP